MSEPKAERESELAEEELVAVARAVKTRGLRGEIVAELLTDFPERFKGLERLIAVAPDGARTVLDLEEHWFQQGRVVLKFAGYDTVEEATALIGSEFTVPESERVELEEDEFYDWELAGCRVETVEGEPLGQVREIMRTGGVEMLVVDNGQGRDYLIPMAEEICVEINVEQKLIRVDVPEGLLEF
ncbi:MAG TPA: ribosome maturation factor RimM [Pyrinomonadaceae bacterium]|jgi:16S rRNA processing protein RimM|nr:ribosome maturation factor RimM [Pyrinomonadaceae bacterium]